jgi:Protein of unknown function (DUF4236)
MGFRFRKRIKLFPGVHLNVSKRGYSISVGENGLTTNISRRGLRETVGLPGTGISCQTKRVGVSRHHRAPRRLQRRSASSAHLLAFVVVAVIVLWILAHLH